MLRTFLDVGLVFFFVMLHYVGVALVILGHVIFMIFLAMLWAFEEGGGVLRFSPPKSSFMEVKKRKKSSF